MRLKKEGGWCYMEGIMGGDRIGVCKLTSFFLTCLDFGGCEEIKHKVLY